jgi:molybdopterin-dependent oxidoreductase alpha subunit
VAEPEKWATGLPAIATSVSRTVKKMGVRRTVQALAVVNQPSGYDCPGCAWPEAAPAERNRIEWCESGAKAVAEEATRARVDRQFIAGHSLVDLRGRSDHWLGEAGRLTEPMVRRPGSTHFEPISWDAANECIAAQLQGLEHPDQAVLYTSGRTSNEAAFVYQLMARCFGTNNLPDCSNMCHEPTSFALQEAIGIGKGSVLLDDFVKADVIVLAGQNPGSNHPRMLATLESAKQAGAQILAINPLPEAGLLRFKNPQKLSGLVGRGTELADIHLPIRLGGDQAMFQLWNKWLLERSPTGSGLDADFIARYTSGYDALKAHLARVDEDSLIDATGLQRHQLAAAFDLVAGADRLIICWAMGITQHRNAMATIQEITNLALLGGHIGREGAGLCPIRGHSNVQGDRTMGIFERPPADLLDALEAEFGVEMPRKDGLDTVDAIASFAEGTSTVLVSLGGNLARSAPDSDFTERALANVDLAVHIATKLNRTQLIAGRTSIVLPALGRTEVDLGASGPQFVSVEDSMGIVHASEGVLAPPSGSVRSEVAIVCGLAEALLPEGTAIWSGFAHDYNLIRDRVAAVIPGFDNFNERIRNPGGFVLPHPPRDERRFETSDGKAHLTVTNVVPHMLGEGQLMLQSLRSHDQYNTTIYGHNDRYRGLSGERTIVMANAADIRALGLVDGERVDIIAMLPGPERRLRDYRLVKYPTPPGTVAAYFPEANVLIPLSHHGEDAQTPAAKAVPIRLFRTAESRAIAT